MFSFGAVFAGFEAHGVLLWFVALAVVVAAVAQATSSKRFNPKPFVFPPVAPISGQSIVMLLRPSVTTSKPSLPELLICLGLVLVLHLFFSLWQSLQPVL